MSEEEEEEGQCAQSLLHGAFDEKESEGCFQEALREWRRQNAEEESEKGAELEPEPQELWGLSETLKGNAPVSGVGPGTICHEHIILARHVEVFCSGTVYSAAV